MCEKKNNGIFHDSGYGCPRCRTHTDQSFYYEDGFLIQECKKCHRKRRMKSDRTGSTTIENIDKDIYDHYQDFLKQQEKEINEQKG
jgi:Zn ribbon nucleic-acid-binding protein